MHAFYMEKTVQNGSMCRRRKYKVRKRFSGGDKLNCSLLHLLTCDLADLPVAWDVQDARTMRLQAKSTDPARPSWEYTPKQNQKRPQRRPRTSLDRPVARSEVHVMIRPSVL